MTKNMVKTMNIVNKELTSLKVWMEDLLQNPLSFRYTGLLQDLNQAQHLQTITIISYGSREQNSESYDLYLQEVINGPLQYPRKNLPHINLKYGDWHFDSSVFFNILQNCPLLESISLGFYKSGQFNEIFQEQCNKILINSRKLKRLTLVFGYSDGLDYQEFTEWLLQVCQLLVYFILNGEVINVERERQKIDHRSKSYEV